MFTLREQEKYMNNYEKRSLRLINRYFFNGLSVYGYQFAGCQCLNSVDRFNLWDKDTVQLQFQ